MSPHIELRIELPDDRRLHFADYSAYDPDIAEQAARGYHRMGPVILVNRDLVDEDFVRLLTRKIEYSRMKSSEVQRISVYFELEQTLFFAHDVEKLQLPSYGWKLI